jgi:hypothetical protein
MTAVQGRAVPERAREPKSSEQHTVRPLLFPFQVSAGFGIFHLSVSRQLLAEDPGNFFPHLHPWKLCHKELCNVPFALQMGEITLDIK